MAEKKKSTNTKVEGKTTKKTTPKANANKTNTTKKANPNNKPKQNTNNNKKKKQTTTNKPKAPKKQTTPKVEKVVEEVKEENDVVIAPVEVVEPEVIENPIEEEKVNEVEENFEPTLEDTQKIEAVIKQEEQMEAEQEKSLVNKKNQALKCEKRIDLGIGIVLLGLIVLIVTTYLSSATSVNKTVIDGLVIGSLVIELIGIIVIVYNTIKSNK